MPTFTYRAISSSGKTVQGKLDAPDRKSLLRKLKQQGLRALDITMRSGTDSAKDEVEAVTVQEKPQKQSRLQTMRSPKGGRKLAHAFLTKLYQLHGSGMPLGDSVQLISQRVREPNLQSLAQEIYRDLSEGRTLAAALRKHPSTFDSATPHLIEAGEATGNLKPIIENLILHIEEQEALKSKVISGLAYPIFIVCMALALGIFCIVFLIPKVQDMLDKLGGELNTISRLMIWLSEFTVTWGPFITGAALIGFALLYQWRRTSKGRSMTDQWLLKVPIASSIIRSANLSRLSSIMHILLKNGVNTTESLRLAENTLTNVRLRGQFTAARTLIQDGAPFSAAFRRYGIMEASDLDILTVGENTGSLIHAFDEVAKLHTTMLSKAFARLTTAVIALAFVIAVTLVGTLIMTVLISFFQIQNTLSAR